MTKSTLNLLKSLKKSACRAGEDRDRGENNEKTSRNYGKLDTKFCTNFSTPQVSGEGCIQSVPHHSAAAKRRTNAVDLLVNAVRSAALPASAADYVTMRGASLYAQRSELSLLRQ